MNKCRLAAGAAVIGSLALLAGALHAGEPKATGQGEAGHQEMMDAWMKQNTPGEQQKMLMESVGTWRLEIKHWMPGAPEPMVSEGSAVRRSVYGGRYLQEEVEGPMPGTPEGFKGMGMFGYDNMAKKYFCTWFDNMSTGCMMATGDYNAATKTMTLTGKYTNPLTGAAESFKWVSKQIDKDHLLFESFVQGPDGKLMKEMEIMNTRTG